MPDLTLLQLIVQLLPLAHAADTTSPSVWLEYVEGNAVTCAPLASVRVHQGDARHGPAVVLSTLGPREGGEA